MNDSNISAANSDLSQNNQEFRYFNIKVSKVYESVMAYDNYQRYQTTEQDQDNCMYVLQIIDVSGRMLYTEAMMK